MLGDAPDPTLVIVQFGFGENFRHGRGGDALCKEGLRFKQEGKRRIRLVSERSTKARGTRKLRADASFKNNDGNDAMRMMLWWKQQTKITRGNNAKHGKRLERRSRGVTTLHHYKRISSWDLGWHRRKTEEEEVKQNCFFDKLVKPRTLRGWKLERRIRQSWTKLRRLR